MLLIQTLDDEYTWDLFKTVTVNITEDIISKHNLYIVNNHDYKMFVKWTGLY